MVAVKNWFNDLIEGWTTFEKIWLLSFVVIGFGVSIAWGDSWIGFISTVTGMVANVLVAKGKISNYAFGIVAVATYGWIAYGYGLYGEMSLNWGFYLGANIIGWMMWNRNKKAKEEKINGEDIPVKKLSKKGWLIVIGIFVVGALAYAEILFLFNAQQVRIDSMAVVLSVIAQILMLYRYSAQWVLWILVNILTIVLWTVTLVQSGGNDYIMLVMWSAYLVNAVYGYINWKKLAK